MLKLQEICRVGVHMSGGQKVNVTQKDLADAVETFAGSVPLPIGHTPNEKLPKLGQVDYVQLSEDGKTLIGLLNYNRLGTQLYAANLYDDFSAALRTNAEGKRYLHHVAVLGSMPPAVKGLQGLDFLNLSDSEIETVQFSEPADGEIIILSSAKNPDEENKSMGKTVEELERELETQKNKNVELEKNNEILLSDKQKSDEANKVEALDRIKKAAEGKIPAGKIPELIALADALPVEAVEIKDGDGKTEKVTPAALLERIIGVLRNLVDDAETIDLSDGVPAGKTKKGEEIGSLMGCV